jgi:hypothetical protein
MADEIVLGPEEVVPGRPFSDPAHSRSDEEALRLLLAHERARARAWVSELERGHRDVVIREVDAEGHRELLVVPDTDALLETRDPVVVGFFGRPRVDVDTAVLFELEEELVAGMGAYAAGGLLSYYDFEFVKGSYGNLILFASKDGPAHWAENPVHHRAVEISPDNYHEIRLHQGTLSGRLLELGQLHVTRTRYLDYGGPEVWRAIRPVLPASSGE